MTAQAGLQCGFGEFLGEATLTSVREVGFTIVRIDLSQPDVVKNVALAQEVIDAGLQPLCIIRRAEQMTGLPAGALVECGNEPDIAKFGWTRESYLAEARRCVAVARETQHRLYLGVVSNLNKRGFAFLDSLPWREWPAEVCCSVHRYPDGKSPFNAHSGFKSRGHEVARLREIVGARPLACSEVGYHDGPGGWTEAEVAQHLVWERRFFSTQGFELVSAFQINDGAATDPSTEAHFGLRRLPSLEWKPSAAAFVHAVDEETR